MVTLHRIKAKSEVSDSDLLPVVNLWANTLNSSNKACEVHEMCYALILKEEKKSLLSSHSEFVIKHLLISLSSHSLENLETNKSISGH